MFEYCLEVLINRISLNFPKYVDIKVGDCYGRIDYYETNIKDKSLNKIYSYYNCKILHIGKYNNCLFTYDDVYSFRSNKFINHGGCVQPSQCYGYIGNFLFIK